MGAKVLLKLVSIEDKVIVPGVPEVDIDIAVVGFDGTLPEW